MSTEDIVNNGKSNETLNNNETQSSSNTGRPKVDNRYYGSNRPRNANPTPNTNTSQAESQSKNVASEANPNICSNQDRQQKPPRQKEIFEDDDNDLILDEEEKPKVYNTDLEQQTESGLSKFRFCKDKSGIFLFLFVYAAIGVQIAAVYITYDYREWSYLYHCKFLFAVTCFMAVWSHIKASFTEPGRIIHYNNNTVINFYLSTRNIALKQAHFLNKKLGKTMMEEKIFTDDVDSDESSYDDVHYKPVSSIGEKQMDKIASEHNIEINRCKQCYVVRIPRTHHCSKCQGCILKMDHHCPWINNCIGQFNQKFFILFCWYCLSGCIQSALIVLYFYIYMHQQEVLDNLTLLIFFPIQLILGVIFIVFTTCMLCDQYTSIKQDTTLIDLKKKKLLECRSFSEVLHEVFGGDFGINWFIPYKTGGYLSIFKKVHKGK